MKHNTKNNLFNYATSELSQDAFICYLLSFAYEDCYDPILTPCAKELIHLFVEEIDGKDLILNEIQKQYPITVLKKDGGRAQKRAIDILLTVQCRGICYKIIVEDKTFTSEHDNQLAIYKETIEKEFPLPLYCVKGVYYKTGFQSNMEQVEKAKYHIVGRKEMIAFLETYIEKTDNLVIRDYCAYWHEFQKEADLFKVLPPTKWSWKQIYGFYEDLQNSISDQHVGYGDVSNPSGGFIAFWTETQECDTLYFQDVGLKLYLQIETASKENEPTSLKICLKMTTREENEKSESLTSARNMLIYRGKNSYRFNEYGFERPEIIRQGRHMTVGIVNDKYYTAAEVKASFLHAIEKMKCLISDIKKEYGI